VTVDSFYGWPIRMPVDRIWGHLTLGHLCQGYWERCSVACGKILTLSPLKSDPLHLIHRSLGPPESTSQIALQLVQQFLQGSWSLQTDRPTDHASLSVVTGSTYLVLWCGLIIYVLCAILLMYTTLTGRIFTTCTLQLHNKCTVKQKDICSIDKCRHMHQNADYGHTNIHQ